MLDVYERQMVGIVSLFLSLIPDKGFIAVFLLLYSALSDRRLNLLSIYYRIVPQQEEQASDT